MKILQLSILLFAVSLICNPAEAKKKRSRASSRACSGENKISSTVYNLPDKNKKETWPNFKTWQKAVEMQGSGINGDRIDTYTGKSVVRPKDCNTTKTSKSGSCLLPYFSVAADPKKGWHMGDIIYIPEIAEAKQLITLPSGRQIQHPGFFIVHDVGGAIKGDNRFDFFVGTVNPNKNDFAKLGLSDKNSCNMTVNRVPREQIAQAENIIYSLQDADSSRGGNSPNVGPEATMAMTER